MALVIDASIAAIWFRPDENDGRADDILDRLNHENAVVPSLFWFEIRNILIKAHKRSRLDETGLRRAITHLRNLPLVDQGSGNDRLILSLCLKEGLTAYDASYLALAMEKDIPIVTADHALEAAAARNGVQVVR